MDSKHPVNKISDVNVKDGKYSHSPSLVRAAQYGMEERCNELIKVGADIESEDDCLVICCQGGFLEYL